MRMTTLMAMIMMKIKTMIMRTRVVLCRFLCAIIMTIMPINLYFVMCDNYNDNNDNNDVKFCVTIMIMMTIIFLCGMCDNYDNDN